MVDDETIKKFTERLEQFQKGFEMITQNINTQLKKIDEQTRAIAKNTDFLPKVMKTNKEIKKFGEKLQIMMDALIMRLDRIAENNNY